MKVYYVCEYCKEIVDTVEIEPKANNLTGHTLDNTIKENCGAGNSLTLSTVCEECLATLGWKDTGLSAWSSGLQVWRH